MKLFIVHYCPKCNTQVRWSDDRYISHNDSCHCCEFGLNKEAIKTVRVPIKGLKEQYGYVMLNDNTLLSLDIAKNMVA